jgi:NTE family protein
MSGEKKLLLDTEKTYAVALEGGGARGAYQIGAWRALDEAGVKYNAVSGTSVGALNGALMAMGDLDRAEDIWKNIKYSSVMDVDDSLMKKFFSRKLKFGDMKNLAKYAMEVLRDGGIDVTPLRGWIAELVDEETLRTSPTELFVTTYSVTDRKELDINVRELPEGQISDMLLASAYFPAFKNEKLGGKRYSDGGVQDVVPINSLLSRGYRDLIVIRIYGVGVERHVKIPQDAQIHTIAPTSDLGSVLNFDSENARELMQLGYYDAQRLLYGYIGDKCYLDKTIDEQKAYEIIFDYVRKAASAEGKTPSLREINEELIPALAKKLGAKTGDYYDVFIAGVEKAALERGLPRFRLMTDVELYNEATQPEKV